jgi:hypothetical protein
MHAADCAFASIEGNIRLGDDRVESVLLELVLTKGPGEEATTILFDIEVDDERPVDSGFREDQSVTPEIELGIGPSAKTVAWSLSSSRSLGVESTSENDKISAVVR